MLAAPSSVVFFFSFFGANDGLILQNKFGFRLVKGPTFLPWLSSVRPLSDGMTLKTAEVLSVMIFSLVP
jgi:hypothetical protein